LTSQDTDDLLGSVQQILIRVYRQSPSPDSIPSIELGALRRTQTSVASNDDIGLWADETRKVTAGIRAVVFDPLEPVESLLFGMS
jgi:hypothetical protein